MQVIYRISETGYPKEKPEYINNKNCFENALRTFNKAIWLVIADNVNDETKLYLESKVETIKYVSVGHGAGTFNLALDYALTLDNNEIVYFLENDYLHKSEADKIIESGFDELSGNYIKVRYKLGDEVFIFSYCHLKALNYVETLKIVDSIPVSKGEWIATMGSSGRSTGIHCHLTIRKNDIIIDPEKSFEFI
jgi:hypothetical protein